MNYLQFLLLPLLLSACGSGSKTPKEDEFVTMNMDSMKALLPYLPNESFELKKYTKGICSRTNSGELYNVVLDRPGPRPGLNTDKLYEYYPKYPNSRELNISDALVNHERPFTEDLIKKVSEPSSSGFINYIYAKKLNKRTALFQIETWYNSIRNYYKIAEYFCSFDLQQSRD